MLALHRGAALLMVGALSMPAHARPRPHPRRVLLEKQRAAPIIVALAPVEPPIPGVVVSAPPEPIAAPPDRPHRVRSTALLASGLTIFAAGWALDIGATYGFGVERSYLSLIPVIGPFAQLGSSWNVTSRSNTGNAQLDAAANARIDSANQTASRVATAVMVVDGLIQVAGLAMTIAGGVPRRAENDRGVQLALAPGGMKLRF